MTDCNTYQVQQGDTLSQIGEWFHVSWPDLARINNIQDANRIYPGQVLRLASSQNVCNAYTVQYGDTLSQIGERFGVDWRQLAHYNHIANPDRILSGQTICIPG
ncbi:LysM peptidoglycan-binding domain-containing protein [Saccharopolyspora sp. NPDC002686]|uniref:LysM peptidoglycan-binding domain-containing protein n=1 Tax=Saccharopolyspora sp. NPDC002686 TaxID=3154541 RepID=UPI0033314808